MNKYIYESKVLNEYINSLEKRYVIESATEKYSRLVNYSQNLKVPFHQWFPYREGFAAELIVELIKMSNAEKDEIIVDPFCGSGTTNVVASAEGYLTLGLDVNPMSAYITNAKLIEYSKEEINNAVMHSWSIVNNASDTVLEKYSEIKKYFPEENYSSLCSIKEYIDALEEGNEKIILTVAFLSIILPSSNRKRDGNGLKTVESKVDNVLKLFEDKVKLIANDIEANQVTSRKKGCGIYDTAFKLFEQKEVNFSSNKVGAIIFSPPYANSFDYFESYKLELVFSDFSDGIKGLNELRKKAVRSFISAKKQNECDEYVDRIANEIEKGIPVKEAETGKKDGRTRKVPDMIKGYFSDMREVIYQCSLVLETGKKVYVVVDQSAYLGKIVPTDLIFAYFAEEIGFKVNRIIECRKARTSTQQLKKYPYLKDALRESILELEKI